MYADSEFSGRTTPPHTHTHDMMGSEPTPAPQGTDAYTSPPEHPVPKASGLSLTDVTATTRQSETQYRQKKQSPKALI